MGEGGYAKPACAFMLDAGKLSVNALIGVGAQRGPGLPDHLQQRGRGGEHSTETTSHPPGWDFVMAAEYCALRGGPDPAAAGGGAHALPEVLEDRLPGLPNERESRRLAPADAVVIEAAGRAHASLARAAAGGRRRQGGQGHLRVAEADAERRARRWGWSSPSPAARG